MILANEYSERRARFYEKMEDSSMALLFSGVAKKKSYDEDYPFEVNRNFYYLTGIDQEDSVLMLIKSEGERREYLFISPFDETKEKWYGKRLTPQEAYLSSGVKNVLMNDSLPARLSAALSLRDPIYGPVKNVYLDFEKEQKIALDTDIDDEKELLRKEFGVASILDSYPILTRMRLRKSEAEVDLLREAIETTRLGILAVMAEARSGIHEYELASTFLKTCNDDDGNQGLAFNTIMASGVHAATLHYPNPLGVVEKGSLILMDLGARKNYYCADVSRTFPVSGRFSPDQRALYEIVLGCNKAVASFARPGITLRELNAFATEYLASECLAKGIIDKKEDISKYYFHSVSHQIGLDTHDPGGNKDLPLEAGNVISDEPGLYIKEKGIGIRIEDDLLITENGAEVLTEGILKEVSEIEQFYKMR